MHNNTHTARIDMQTSPVYSPSTDAQQRSIVLPRRDTCHAAHSARRQTRVRLRQHTPRVLRTRARLCSLHTAHPATPIAASHAPHQCSLNPVNRLARRALCTAYGSQLSSAHCAREASIRRLLRTHLAAHCSNRLATNTSRFAQHPRTSAYQYVGTCAHHQSADTVCENAHSRDRRTADKTSEHRNRSLCATCVRRNPFAW